MEPNPKPTVFSLLRATILGAGALALWSFLFLWLTSIHQRLYRSTANESIAVLSSGSPAIRVFRRPGEYRGYQTLDRQPLANLDMRDELDYFQLPARQRDAIEPSWDQRIASFALGPRPTTFWYLVQDEHGQACFEGYDSQSRRLIGYLGRRGFSATRPALADRFELNRTLPATDRWFCQGGGQTGGEPRDWGLFTQVVYLTGQRDLWKIDLKRQTSQRLFSADEIVSATIWTDRRPDDDKARRLPAVRLPDRVVWLDDSGATVRSLRLSAPDQRARLCVWNLGDAATIVESKQPDNPVARLTWFDRAGAAERDVDVPLRELDSQPSAYNALKTAIMLPALPVLAPEFFVRLPRQMRVDDLSNSYSARLRRLAPAIAPALAMVLAVSLVLAVRAYRRNRRLQLSNSLAWASFVAIGGPFGLVGYLLENPQPVGSQCPECGALSRRDRPVCACCRQPWPAPALNGCEVFGY